MNMLERLIQRFDNWLTDKKVCEFADDCEYYDTNIESCNKLHKYNYCGKNRLKNRNINARA